MIKEHSSYNINDAVYSIKSKIASKPLDGGERADIPSFSFLFKEPYNSFKATVACLKLKLKEDLEPKDKILIYQTISSEVNKAMAEDLDCFDSIIFGDYLFGIFYTPMKESMKRLIDCLAKMNSTVLLFKKLSGLIDLNYAIAADYGDVYLIDVKDDNGKILDYNWYGSLFQHVSQMADDYATGVVRVSSFIYNNIPDNYQKFFSIQPGIKHYGADVVNTIFYNWKEDNVITNNQ